ncbi:hypothetical protein TGDOM2_271430 [Toxoplasma gondii GAB2-2007-GAL-DOM2]|uniref:Tetratricopeptide repeat-containing protein n=6 Tax=Toxoplasma gondii TaxID=5811 RepID=S7WKC3_TOXGG|nr:hypothetical protein TGGT1_271430 [Toxoplasma gondii GT1]KAF4642184.1 hypothetical protein TGRH88_079970 [Toxoplasma gondii]KFG43441.1 hypothetical protein TGDOM2_271430 [Toxoplasma gondii GAB2-2007-GAL-DOM2]KFG54265.1 hypothetical protein TGFOU_271430 [Toxoplasma gondii FOU]PUA92208.1 hypothetical protein TGBR9_271430 [Toxoplasma gondii TgCATBr9]RQX75377.1 hypothetical protein TGCAST_271430 [Toxoplasma gondii CAST]
MESDLESGSDLLRELNFNSDDEPPSPQAGDVTVVSPDGCVTKTIVSLGKELLHAGFGDEICVRWHPLPAHPGVLTPEKSTDLLRILEDAQPQWTTLGQSAAFPQLLSLAARRMCLGEVAVVSGPASHLREPQKYLYSPAALAGVSASSSTPVTSSVSSTGSSSASSFPSSYAAFRKHELVNKRRALRALREKADKENKDFSEETRRSLSLSLGSIDTLQGGRALPPASPRPPESASCSSRFSRTQVRSPAVGGRLPRSVQTGKGAEEGRGRAESDAARVDAGGDLEKKRVERRETRGEQKGEEHREEREEENTCSVVLQLLSISPIRRLTEDGGLRMRLLRPGTGWRTPGRNDLVSFSLVVLCKDAVCRETQLNQILHASTDDQSSVSPALHRDGERQRDTGEIKVPRSASCEEVEDLGNQEGREKREEAKWRVGEEKMKERHEGGDQSDTRVKRTIGISCCKEGAQASSPSSSFSFVRCREEIALSEAPLRGLRTALRHLKHGEEVLLTLEGEHSQLAALHTPALASWTCACCGQTLEETLLSGNRKNKREAESEREECLCCCRQMQSCACICRDSSWPGEEDKAALYLYVKMDNWRPRATISVPSPVNDSKSLGTVAFTLLMGAADERQRTLVREEGDRDAAKAMNGIPVNWRPEEGSTVIVLLSLALLRSSLSAQPLPLKCPLTRHFSPAENRQFSLPSRRDEEPRQQRRTEREGAETGNAGIWLLFTLGDWSAPPWLEEAVKRLKMGDVGRFELSPSLFSQAVQTLPYRRPASSSGEQSCKACDWGGMWIIHPPLPPRRASSCPVSASCLWGAAALGGSLACASRSVEDLVRETVDGGSLEAVVRCVREKEATWRRPREAPRDADARERAQAKQARRGEKDEGIADDEDGQTGEEEEGSRRECVERVIRVEWEGEEEIKKKLEEATREEVGEYANKDEDSEDTRVLATIWLASILDRRKELWARGSPDEKCALVERLRHEGNLLLKRGLLSAAAHRYSRAFDVCRFLPAYEEATRVQPLLASSQGPAATASTSASSLSSSSSSPSASASGGRPPRPSPDDLQPPSNRQAQSADVLNAHATALEKARRGQPEEGEREREGEQGGEEELSLVEVTRLATGVLNNWALCCLRQSRWREALRHASVSLLLLDLVGNSPESEVDKKEKQRQREPSATPGAVCEEKEKATKHGEEVTANTEQETKQKKQETKQKKQETEQKKQETEQKQQTEEEKKGETRGDNFQHARCVALYRKAKALSEGGEIAEAINAAKAAAAIESGDSAIQNLLKTLLRHRARALKSERETFLGMFQRAPR